MLKTIFGWIANFADTLGEALESLSHYPGLGWLAPIGDSIGSIADKYSLYLQKIEWQKTRLQATKSKAGEVAEMVTPGGGSPKDETPPDAVPAEAPSDSPGLPSTAASTAPPPAAGRDSDYRGTVMFDTTVPETRGQAAASVGDREPVRPGTRSGRVGTRTPFYGTLDGPGQSLDTEPPAEPGRLTIGKEEPGRASAAELAPPDYAAARDDTWDEREVGRASAARGREVEPEERAVPAVAPRERAPAARPTAPRRAAPAPREMPAPTSAAPTEEETWAISQATESLLDEDQPALIPPAEREVELARLEYLGHLLRDAREPLSGVNGTLVLLTLETLQAGARETVEVPRAVKGDLTTLQDQLGLRFPAAALVVGLEDHRGFEELVRRIGPERAASQRLGHRFDVRAPAIASQLAALCARLAGVFEDWVYAIFRERGAVARQGNSHLFGLLCQVRTELQPRLLRILSGGFGQERMESDGNESLGFSGCYFAATGRTEDRRAFVRGVFDKLTEEQDQVEWLSRARTGSSRYRRFGWLGLLVAAGFAAWLLFELAVRPSLPDGWS